MKSQNFDVISFSVGREICIWRRLEGGLSHSEGSKEDGSSEDESLLCRGRELFSLHCVMKGHRARVWDICLVNLGDENVLVSAG